MATRIPLKRLFIGALLALSLAACATSGERIDWHDNDSYSGWVTDAVTGEPLEGVVVIAVWEILWRHYFIVEGSPHRETIRLEETLTDKEGRFRFAPLGNYAPPLAWERNEGRFPKLAFFKPGYEPTYRDRFNWEFGEETNLPRGSPTPRALKKLGWQREIPLYRYLTRPLSVAETMNPSDRRMTDKEKILARLTNFAHSLESNVTLAGKNIRDQRKAAEAQRSAILTMDEEIRQYRPKFEWHNAAIEALLRENVKRGRR
jgi:hypothetical protein